MSDNIFSAYHYACKTKADKEAIEQIYEEVKKSAQNAIYRNIGDIFFTARTDTEINGAVECNGGTYSTADFEGKQTVGNLLASGSLPYVSLSEYESLVSANGSCRAFGWDGGTEFRVPTIPALLLTKEQSAVFGNGMTLGLTNDVDNFGLSGVDANGGLSAQTNLYGTNVGTTGSAWPNSGNKAIGVTADPTKSGIVANLDVIEYRAMVQLASGATDQAVITATSALQQLANKVDKTSQTDRETVVGWGMPDFTAEVSIPLSTYVLLPVDALVYGKGAVSGYQTYGISVSLDGINEYIEFQQNGQYGGAIGYYLPKGVYVKIYKTCKTKSAYYPLKGVN